MNYLLNLLIALDQLANAILVGASDETLSARAFRTEQSGKIFGRFFRPLIDGLLWVFEREHCKKAYIAERQRLQLPRDYQ